MIRYSPEELFQIGVNSYSSKPYRKARSYLAVWLKFFNGTIRGLDPVYIQIKRLSKDRRESNSAFKRRWIYEHGSLKGLKEFKDSKPTAFVAVRATFKEQAKMVEKTIMQGFKALRESIGTPVRGKANGKPPKEVTAKAAKADRHPGLGLRSLRFQGSGGRGLVRIAKYQNGVLDSLGGKAIYIGPFTGPPHPRHKKYCYFYRKFGIWFFSEHHPYGDEDQTYKVIWA